MKACVFAEKFLSALILNHGSLYSHFDDLIAAANKVSGRLLPRRRRALSPAAHPGGFILIVARTSSSIQRSKGMGFPKTA